MRSCLKNLIYLTAIAGLVILLSAAFMSDSRIPKDYWKALAYVRAAVRDPGQRQVVTLPSELAPLTSDGNVYVTVTQSGFMFLFRTYIGKGDNFRGWLFVEGSVIEPGRELQVTATSPPNRITVRTIVTKAHSEDGWYDVWTDFLD